jgi:predicted phage terminase large subunit-like protein
LPAASWNSLYQQHPTIAEGNFFKPGFIPIVDAIPPGLTYVRAWDFAATQNAGDYTVGLKLGFDRKNVFKVIVDVVRGQYAPEQVKQLLKATAEKDGRHCKILIPQDPGQAGKAQVQNLVALLQGFSVKAVLPSGSKETRADPVASQVNVGNIGMVRSGWNWALIEELRNFPFGKNDDQVDAFSDAYNHTFQRKRGLM